MAYKQAKSRLQPRVFNRLTPNRKDAGKEKVSELEVLSDEFTQACQKPEPDRNEIETKLNELRKLILTQGIPEDRKISTGTSLRGKIWKIMLALDKVDGKEYLALLEKGQCETKQYQRIRGDTFRTFGNSKKFWEKIEEKQLVRMLNSFSHKYAPKFQYIQGMNCVAGIFLYCLPEVDAFFCLCKLLIEKFPLYWVSAYVGVEAACRLIDRCLEAVDPELKSKLDQHKLNAYLYAFFVVNSLMAGLRPFEEVLKLWDFLLTFGPHLLLLCVVSHILSLREQILKSTEPNTILNYRTWPEFKAKQLIHITMSIIPQLSPDLMASIAKHATDIEVTEKLTGRKVQLTAINPVLPSPHSPQKTLLDTISPRNGLETSSTSASSSSFSSFSSFSSSSSSSCSSCSSSSSSSSSSSTSPPLPGLARSASNDNTTPPPLITRRSSINKTIDGPTSSGIPTSSGNPTSSALPTSSGIPSSGIPRRISLKETLKETNIPSNIPSLIPTSHSNTPSTTATPTSTPPTTTTTLNGPSSTNTNMTGTSGIPSSKDPASLIPRRTSLTKPNGLVGNGVITGIESGSGVGRGSFGFTGGSGSRRSSAKLTYAPMDGSNSSPPSLIPGGNLSNSGNGRNSAGMESSISPQLFQTTAGSSTRSPTKTTPPSSSSASVTWNGSPPKLTSTLVTNVWNGGSL